MAEKSPSERYRQQLSSKSLKKSYQPNNYRKWLFENLFDEIKKFNNYHKLDSWQEFLEQDFAYTELRELLDNHCEHYKMLLGYAVREAENEKNAHIAHSKITEGINQLKAYLTASAHVERWYMKNETLELFSVSWFYLSSAGTKLVVSKSQLKESIKELERCKTYLEVKNPDLTAPAPKDTQTPALDETEPPQPPKEGTNELYAGLEWKADKADLAELIKGLAFTKSIQKDGKSITQKDLQALFESLFNTRIGDLHKTFSARLESNKHLENRFFVESIYDHIESLYKKAASEIRRQAEKRQE